MNSLAQLWVVMLEKKKNILTIFVLPINEHGMFSVSFSFFNFFHKLSIVFSIQIFFTSLVRFIPRDLIVFGTVVNRINSLISFSVASLLVYRNANYFCKLIFILWLCWIHVPVLVVFWWSFGFSMYSIMSSAKSESLTSLPIWIILFHFVIWLLRLGLLTLCLATGVRVDISVVFLFLGGKLSVFPHWRWC